LPHSEAPAPKSTLTFSPSFALTDADFIIAVNKNPNATMMKMADVAVVADANQVCSALIKALKKRIQSKADYSD
jgi:hypothetical protein